MKIREEIQADEKAARGMAVAAVIQAVPPIMWAFLVGFLIVFIGLAVGFHIHDMPLFVDAALHWLFVGAVVALALVGVRLAVKGYGIYHDVITAYQTRRIGSSNMQRQAAAARKADLINEQLEVRISLERQLPAVIQFALANGHNIDYDGKGLKIQNYQQTTVQMVPGAPAPALLPGADYMPQPYTMSEVLRGFTPSKDGILLAKGRELITCPIGESLCHTTFTGNTDAGKTNNERMLLIQLLYLEQTVFLCDRNYQTFRIDKKNAGVVYDYSSIESQLAYPPVVTAPGAVDVLKYLTSELEVRRTARRKAIVHFTDIYLFMDELPAFCSEDAQIMQHVGRLVREARQYGIFFVGAAQDLLNQTLNNDNGAIRDNLLTNYYGGGDATTARMVLNLAKGETIDETGLGKMGAVYLRAKGAGIEHIKVRTPLSDNQATLTLLADRSPVAQLPQLWKESPLAPPRDTGELATPPLDGDLLRVFEAAKQLGMKTSSRKVEELTGIDKDRANALLHRLEDMGYIQRKKSV